MTNNNSESRFSLNGSSNITPIRESTKSSSRPTGEQVDPSVQRPGFRLCVFAPNGGDSAAFLPALTQAGHVPTQFDSVRNALAAWETGAFDALVVCDFATADTNETTWLVAQLRRRELPGQSTSVIVAIVADNDGARRQALGQSGVTAILDAGSIGFLDPTLRMSVWLPAGGTAKRGLLIEDDIKLSVSIWNDLRLQGVHLDRADSVPEALAACQYHPYDLIIIGQGRDQPSMPTAQLVANLRGKQFLKNQSAPMIVLLTNSSARHDVEATRNAGADHVVIRSDPRLPQFLTHLLATDNTKAKSSGNYTTSHQPAPAAQPSPNAWSQPELPSTANSMPSPHDGMMLGAGNRAMPEQLTPGPVRFGGSLWRPAVLTLGLVAAAGAGWTFLDWLNAGVAVEAIQLQATSVPTYATTAGQVVSKKEVNLASRQTGQLYRVYAETGKLVRRGETLAILDNREALINVRRSETQVFRYRTELEFAETALHTQNSAASNKRDPSSGFAELESNIAILRSKVMAAEADLAAAQLAVEKFAIVAPFSAVVVGSGAVEGRWVNAGEALYTIADLDTLEVAIIPHGTDKPDIQSGATVRLSTDGSGNDAWEERVDRMIGDGSNGSDIEPVQRRGVAAYVTLGENAPRLMINQRVSVELLTTNARNAIVVPKEIVIDHAGRPSIARVNGGRVHYVAVATSNEHGTHVELTSGANPGDLVALPRRELAEGQRITATKLPNALVNAQPAYPHRAEYPNVAIISAKDLRTQYDKATIVDLRSRFAFGIAHIASAVNLPKSEQGSAEKLKELRSRAGQNPVVVYCDDPICQDAYEIVQNATRAGGSGFYAYDGGLTEWMETAPDHSYLLGRTPAGRSQLVSPEFFQAHLIDAETFQKRRQDKDAVVIDLGNSNRSPSTETDDVGSLAEITNQISRGQYRDKEVLFAGLNVNNARWLQYLLENNNYRNYLFNVY